MTRQQCKEAAIKDFVELLLVGYSPYMIYQAWCKSQGHDRSFNTCLAILVRHGFGRKKRRLLTWRCTDEAIDFLRTFYGIQFPATDGE